MKRRCYSTEVLLPNRNETSYVFRRLAEGNHCCDTPAEDSRSEDNLVEGSLAEDSSVEAVRIAAQIGSLVEEFLAEVVRIAQVGNFEKDTVETASSGSDDSAPRGTAGHSGTAMGCCILVGHGPARCR